MIPLGVLSSRRPATAGGGHSITYLSAASGSHLTSIGIGSPGSDRHIILAVALTGGTTVTSVTVSGVPATIHYTQWDGAAGVAICSAHVPTSTVADVVVSTSATPSAVLTGLWAAYGNLAFAGAGQGAVGSVTVTAPASAVSIVCYSATNDVAPGSASIQGFTLRHPGTFDNKTRQALGDATPDPGPHTVSVGGAPQYFSVLALAQFSLA